MVDSQELSKLKDFLVEKVKKAKDKLNIFETEKANLESQLMQEREVKDYLIMRVHDLDLQNALRISEIAKLMEKLPRIEREKEELIVKLSREVEEFNHYRKLLSHEITTLRQKFKISQTQKSELLSAFEEFSKVFNSLGLIK